MHARIPWRLTAALTAAAAAVAISGLTAAPASAGNSYAGAAYVSGKGGFADDWYDEGILSTSTNTNSNATCLWQKVLWADGLLAWEDIDGIFGPKTRDATRTFQARHHLDDDGVVGEDTFGWAGSYGKLEDIDGDTTVDRYIGPRHRFTIWRDGDGHYGFYDDGVKRSAGYNYRTCS